MDYDPKTAFGNTALLNEWREKERLKREVEACKDCNTWIECPECDGCSLYGGDKISTQHELDEWRTGSCWCNMCSCEGAGEIQKKCKKHPDDNETRIDIYYNRVA